MAGIVRGFATSLLSLVAVLALVGWASVSFLSSSAAPHESEPVESAEGDEDDYAIDDSGGDDLVPPVRAWTTLFAPESRVVQVRAPQDGVIGWVMPPDPVEGYQEILAARLFMLEDPLTRHLLDVERRMDELDNELYRLDEKIEAYLDDELDDELNGQPNRRDRRRRAAHRRDAARLAALERDMASLSARHDELDIQAEQRKLVVYELGPGVFSSLVAVGQRVTARQTIGLIERTNIAHAMFPLAEGLNWTAGQRVSVILAPEVGDRDCGNGRTIDCRVLGIETDQWALECSTFWPPGTRVGLR